MINSYEWLTEMINKPTNAPGNQQMKETSYIYYVVKVTSNHYIPWFIQIILNINVIYNTIQFWK